MKLTDKIQFIPGVGPYRAGKLNKMGIMTVGDLIYYFPRAWQDFTHPVPINSCRINDEVIIKAKIKNINSLRSPRKSMFITRALLIDGNDDTIEALWFNQPYLEQYLKSNTTWLFAGKISFDFSSHQKVLNAPIFQAKPVIIPIYPETEGINSKYLAKIVKIAIERINITDWLAQNLVKMEKLLPLPEAIKEIHFPINNLNLSKAKHRLAFDELLLLSLKLQLRKYKFQSHRAPKIDINQTVLSQIICNLPFSLTTSQNKCLQEILSDLTKNIPMTRLLNGDVGSGKTVVAAIASLICINNDYQVVWLAPTEILATQHYQTIAKLFKKENIKIGLLTANNKAYNKFKNQNVKCKITMQNAKLKKQILGSNLIIGTHALIQEGIKFNNLGLVMVDEEHRFGTKQRAWLIASRTHADSKKTADSRGRIQRQSALSPQGSALVPHYLAMTATPIPRTLANAIYADMDVSVIDELPSGRKPIITRVVEPENRQKAYNFIRQHITNGRQCFVICPLIQLTTNNYQLSTLLTQIEKKSVKAEYEKLHKKIFPDLKIAMLHGRMKSRDKQKIMADFVKNKIDILVSTSVVEVGVDIPNANVMLIEDADRFGLAQLHQFRGRVGRDVHQSFCLLFSNSDNEKSINRLKAMEKFNNGFKLAQIDLVTRGPGEFIGIRQSGFSGLKIARLSDTITLAKAKTLARKIIDEGLEKYPEIINKLTSKHEK